MAIQEDLGREHDWTTLALVPPDAMASARLVARQPGTVAGIPSIPLVLDETNADIEWQPAVADGETIALGTEIGCFQGSARDILTLERTILNFLGRLSGIATFTRQYIEAVRGTHARVYDTRKTTPGWRLLDKYAVQCGGGSNHRTGLYDAILIKDNHLAFASRSKNTSFTLANAVEAARKVLQEVGENDDCSGIVEIEVDNLTQLREVLPAKPDIVMLDNFTPEELSEGVRLRDLSASDVQLEASGRVTLANVREVAMSGVDRISVGALTHSAPNFDVSLDWDA